MAPPPAVTARQELNDFIVSTTLSARSILKRASTLSSRSSKTAKFGNASGKMKGAFTGTRVVGQEADKVQLWGLEETKTDGWKGFDEVSFRIYFRAQGALLRSRHNSVPFCHHLTRRA